MSAVDFFTFGGIAFVAVPAGAFYGTRNLSWTSAACLSVAVAFLLITDIQGETPM